MPYSPYGTTLPTVAGDANVWGTTLNSKTFLELERAYLGVEAISLTGNLTLSSTNGDINAQVRNTALFFSDGGLAATPTVTIPGLERVYYVKNTGATYAITFSAGGVTANLGAGYVGLLSCDGTDVTIDEFSLASDAGSAATSAAAAAASASAAATSAASIDTAVIESNSFFLSSTM